jgi:hypothetical protein
MAFRKNQSRLFGRRVYLYDAAEYEKSIKPKDGAFDERKLILMGVNDYATKADVAEHLSNFGNIMEVDLPKSSQIPEIDLAAHEIDRKLFNYNSLFQKNYQNELKLIENPFYQKMLYFESELDKLKATSGSA